MTVAELINQTLEMIWNQFETYHRNPHDFARDKNALMKAIARVGYACEQNGWQMDVEECRGVIMTVLNDIKLRQDRINYLPVYLHGAIGRHLGQKAEEYSAKQKARGSRSADNLVRRVREKLDGVEVVTVVKEKSATETLSELYIALKKTRRKKPAVKDKQPSLL
jgi:hypothetical protein